MNSSLPVTPTSYEHLAVIRAAGADAVTFLQGQLSNDFALLPLNQWQLAAYCSPKGRMLASFWGLKQSNQEILLVLSKDILAPTLKRLAMFVLRAKVQLTDASDLLPQLAAQHGLAAWSEREVERGIARITAPLVDLFVPQMLNYESIGGVSFKKGCYPGQEIVARSQFRGAIKRRTYLVQVLPADSDTAVDGNLPVVGEDVFADNEAESVGTVVQLAQMQALICIQTSSANVHLKTAKGYQLKLLPLPYALLEDI